MPRNRVRPRLADGADAVPGSGPGQQNRSRATLIHKPSLVWAEGGRRKRDEEREFLRQQQYAQCVVQQGVGIDSQILRGGMDNTS